MVKKFLDILLVAPDYHNNEMGGLPHIPCGLGYIARSIETNDYSYRVVDLSIQPESDLFNIIKEDHPRYLGISLMTYRVEKSYQLLETVKNNYPWLKIIIGGPHVIAVGLPLFQECQAIDISCIGEGEETIIEILNGVQISLIKGIHYRTTEGVFSTEQRQFTKSIDNIPFPTYTGFDIQKYGTSMLLSSSRGCPYKCTFCGAPQFLGNIWRKRNSNGMLEELMYWYENGYREFYFEDSLFSADKKRIQEFCDELINLNLSVHIDVNGARADHFDEFTLKKMKKANFRTIVFGVESAKNHVLEAFKKGETIEQIETTLRIVDNLGFTMGLFFIIGGPGESYEDAIESIDFAQKFKNVSFTYFFKLTPIPGTSYFEYATRMGYVDKNNKYPTGNFGFDVEATHGNDVMSSLELSTALKKARHIERLIRLRHYIRNHLQLKKFCIPTIFIEPLAQLLAISVVNRFARRIVSAVRSISLKTI